MIVVDWVSLFVVVFNVAVSGTFIIAYHGHRAHAWRFSWFGQSVMILAVAVLMFSVLGLLGTVLGPNYWGEDVLRLLARMIVTVAMTQRLWVLLRIERSDRVA